ncbi:HemK2/MTQ2 family protein methyltransferase [Streptomyces sp. PSAA01]|uniref:HemK2/MTQ2 family protein methyltransferase n=1 Tax=Streptomyces sp. PSAA01 TaxID=2912762 RepID=UPI001F014871|nr:HemK2/MTQ2 family protein methyltransferase [Streptomyces sp. PSAA01]MCG0285509.1 methyltransferase [Streptomyces sp. PSAA01]
MMFKTPPGVYAPQDDTWLLAEALLRERITAGTAVLDVGTGSGALALVAAGRGAAQVTAVDVSPLAVGATWLRARLKGLPVRVLHGDLLTPVADRGFDLIVANPPYVPVAGRWTRGRGLAWRAGADGRALLDRICRDAPPLLRPGGVLLLVHSALSGTERTVAQLTESGLRAAVADRRTIPFGPVLRAQAPWLEAQGLIAPGETKEELVVIRAERRT